MSSRQSHPNRKKSKKSEITCTKDSTQKGRERVVQPALKKSEEKIVSFDLVKQRNNQKILITKIKSILLLRVTQGWYATHILHL